jgi:hypothetical protein
VVSLVILVLEDDQSESDVAGADDERDAGDANERQLPAVDEADDGACHDCGETLDDGSEGRSGEAADLLGIIGERGREGAGLR